MGAVSDRIGRRPILLTFTALDNRHRLSRALRGWSCSRPSARCWPSDLWLSFLYASYNGAMVVALTEIVPASVRTAGFSLAYSLATALFGGFTPAVSTALIDMTGDKASPGLWMTFAAICGFLASLMVYRRGEATRNAVAAAA